MKKTLSTSKKWKQKKNTKAILAEYRKQRVLQHWEAYVDKKYETNSLVGKKSERVRELMSEGGDIRDLDGGKPTEAEAKDLIREARGSIEDTHGAHYNDGKNTHLYPHVHYHTASGIKGAIEIIMEILS